jgi:O-antigen ligase
LLLVALAVMALTYVWRVQDLFPTLGRLSPALLTTGVALAAWVLNADPRRRLRHLNTTTMRLVLVFVALMLLSVPGSIWQGNSVRFLYQDFGLTFVFMVLVAASIRARRDVEWFALAHVLGATLYSAVVLTRGKIDADGRLGGLSYYDANDLAMVLVCTLPMTVYFLRREIKTWRRLAAFAALLLLTLTIVKTGSRGGFLGLIVAMGYILFRYRAIKPMTRFAAVLAGGLVLMAIGSESYWQRIQTMLRPEEDYNWSDNNLSGRKAVWMRGLGYMAQRPLLGVGVRNFGQAEGTISQMAADMRAINRGFKWSAPHNSFVEVGAEVGVPALIVFVALLIASIRAMARLRPRRGVADPDAAGDAALGQALIGSLIAYMVSGFFLTQAFSAYLYCLLAMVIGLSKLHRAPATPPPPRVRRRVGLVGALSPPGHVGP